MAWILTTVTLVILLLAILALVDPPGGSMPDRDFLAARRSQLGTADQTNKVPLC